jgi:hypothetical protein
MIGAGTDDPDLDSVLGIPASKTVKDIDVVTGVEVIDGTFPVDFESV